MDNIIGLVSGLKYHIFHQPLFAETIYLVKEPYNTVESLAVALYNEFHERMGYASSKLNKKVFYRIVDDRCTAKAWWIFRTFILIEFLE